jgi:hypothetical protein
MLLDAQQQHHASVLANAWGESDRRAALAALVKSADNVDSLAAVWLTCRWGRGVPGGGGARWGGGRGGGGEVGAEWW